MNRRVSGWSFFGALLFFITISLTVTLAVTIYAYVYESTGGERGIVALVMLLVILFLSVLCTILDIFRRKFMIDRPVEQIVNATEKIALGDFSVRLRPRHGYHEYDEYDVIMDNLNVMAETLGRSEILKTDFISNVSHELKTPIAILQNYAQLLQREKDEEKREQYVDTLISASKRLSGLVSNVLQLSRLENEKIQTERALMRLDESIAEAVIGLETKIEAKNLDVRCDLDEVEIFSVPGYLEIVWSNLLSNAVKFTDEGGMVEVSLKKEGNFAVVCVRDSGCGISAETGAHIFDKFYQGDTSHAQEGNGLGLALVKKVIDVLGGEISVESELGKGTAFTVVLKDER
ncbi:MAG: HAMP domain-containing histidine kinase [Clostridia bacterium]|nr:HAMP domain-containing histidine kinase [Clostridia bacterium]